MPFFPKDAANSCIRRAERLLDLAANELPGRRIKNDLRRSALVMAVTAIDSYMHWLVYRRISEVRQLRDLPKQLARLDIAFADFASLADATIDARQAQRDIRPWVHVKNVVQKRLQRETFQSYDQVASAFALAGIDKAWSSTAVLLGISPEAIKTRLNQLVQRRNQVVHEGDIKRASLPRDLRFNSVDHAAILAEVRWIKTLIDAFEQVVTAQNPPT
jgi:uncharacterized protein YutE (UPF0331/DUF86 family)